MPSFPIIDAHVHFWDPKRLSYEWLRGNELLSRPYLIEDYRQACGDVDVAGLVFVECAVDRGLFEAEVRFIEEQAARDSLIQAVVAQASLEEGSRALPFLQHLKATTPLLRGIRRIIEHEADPDFCLKLVDGIRLLGPLDLSFEICVDFRQMESVLRLVDLVGDVRLMLDHCGKPGIRGGHLVPWKTQVRQLAGYPNVMCKVSGLATEADRTRGDDSQLRPYVDAVVEAFGFDRLAYGGDWPVCLEATNPLAWITFLDRCFIGVRAHDVRRFYRDNAIEFYRLQL